MAHAIRKPNDNPLAAPAEDDTASGGSRLRSFPTPPRTLREPSLRHGAPLASPGDAASQPAGKSF